MKKSDKIKSKKEFKAGLDKFADNLKRLVSTESGDWTIKGFIDVFKNIYTISSDTKIVSKILEIHIFPQILDFADKIGYKILLADKQNWYPDLTFIHKDNDEIKFAVDIKTTYRDPKTGKNATGFTLGSHGTYFKERDGKKNIQFPYSQYSGHFVLGIIYTRVDFSDADSTEIYQVQELLDNDEPLAKKIGHRKVTNVKNLKSITSVIKDFDFFAAEKWKIASDSQGSGNTANIGSITDINDLKNENGIFSKLGEEWFDEYWINYGTATMIKDGKTIKISKLRDFLEFKGKKDLHRHIVEKAAKKRENT
ncbi:MAG: type II restriction endonuclease [Bacteroidia bacterium]